MDSASTIPSSAFSKPLPAIHGRFSFLALPRQHKEELPLTFPPKPGDFQDVAGAGAWTVEGVEAQCCNWDSTPIGRVNGVEHEPELCRSGLRKRRGQVNPLDSVDKWEKILQFDSSLCETHGLTLIKAFLQILERWWLLPSFTDEFAIKCAEFDSIIADLDHTNVDSSKHDLVEVGQDSPDISRVTSPVRSEGLRAPPESNPTEDVISTSEQAPLTVEVSHQQSREYRRALMAICVREKRTYTCFYLLAVALLLILASLVISFWWSAGHDDVSGGFGMGSYMVGLSSAIVALAGYAHRSNCRCWNREQALPMWEIDNNFGDYNLVRRPHGRDAVTSG
ncbi:hypothetical protein F5Y06DRAFT_296367 [Hypoxylon sp. FL0890]|nr:hypothetical protein F5Y06DRAFT_296367 [Hypoxylon sp. FL0890]